MNTNRKNKILMVSETDDKTINLVDIFMYLLFHWKWYLLSILLFVGYFAYQYSETPFMYSRYITVMIKTPANSQSTMRLNRYNSFATPVNVASEILQFKSRELFRKTVDKLQANVSYVVKNKLRDNELYNLSPVRVAFLNSNSSTFSFSATPVNSNKVLLSDFSSMKDKKIVVNFNDTVITPAGLLVVYKSDNYKSNWFGQTVRITRYTRESMVDYLLSNITITQLEDDAAILYISLKDHSVNRANDVLNTVVAIYNELAIQDKNNVAYKTEEFIKGRLAIIEEDLGSVETGIESLKTANDGVDVNTSAEMFISDSRQYESAIKDLDTQLNLVGFMKQFLQDPHNDEDLIPHNTGFVDVNIENQIMQYNNTVLKRNRLVEGSSERNPIVEEFNRSIVSMRGNIMSAVDNVVASLHIKRRDMARQAGMARQKVYAVPKEQRMMLSMERKQKVKEELYIFLLNKREENALNRAMVDDNARVIDTVSGSVYPISPSMYKKLLLGFACGMGLPTVLLLLLLLTDNRVRTRKDIIKSVSVPFLGDIPLEKNLKSDQGVSVTAQGQDSLTEAFRILRTNLNFMNVTAQSNKVIVFTSFSVGAGKTFVSLNLAVSMAQVSPRVLLLDLDLRKASLSYSLYKRHKQKRLGVVHYLSDVSLTPDDIISQDLVCPDLDVIPVGVIAPNPAELLLSPRLDELITELKKRYRYIIVDGVPVGLVADASIVNRISDLTFFVIRSGDLDRRMLPELQNLYQEKKLTNMGIVLNGTKRDGRTDTYGYGYGYGHGYGYSHQKDKRMNKWIRRFDRG